MKTYLKIELDTNASSGRDLDCEITFVTGEFSNYRSRDYLSDYTVNQAYQPNNGDTFFFLPGVTVPRVKLKDLQSDYKIKTVRDIESANAVFISPKSFEKIIDNTWAHYCDTIEFKRFIEDAHNNRHITQYYYDKIVTALEFYTEDKIITEWPTNRILLDKNYNYCVDNALCTTSSQRFDYVNENYVDVYSKLSQATLYIDSSLMPYINGADAVTIDKAMYTTLSEMLSSSDKDNYVIAMEIMANSNYHDSLAYLCLLFHNFGNRIEDQPTKNHVNFKSLRNYMGFSRGYCSLSNDQCMKQLIDKGAVTRDNVKILLDEFTVDTACSGNSTYFKVKEVCVSEEIDKLLNEELVVQVKENYKPETIQNESTDTADIFF